MSRPRPSGRSYGRLTRHERNAIERMLDRNRSAREIAAELGRSPSTVTREVAAHRYVTAPRSRYGEPAPADLSGACPRLSAWPRCCNGCSHRRGYGCSRRPRVFYSARRAQEAADAELSGSRSGIDETEEGAAAKLAAIRDGLTELEANEVFTADEVRAALTARDPFSKLLAAARQSPVVLVCRNGMASADAASADAVAAIHRLADVARFGLEQALAAWPTNPSALRGLARYAVERGH